MPPSESLPELKFREASVTAMVLGAPEVAKRGIGSLWHIGCVPGDLQSIEVSRCRGAAQLSRNAASSSSVPPSYSVVLGGFLLEA
jgi:hypothetical protein